LIYLPFTHMVPQSAADVVIATLGFFVQVYCDFSGYTDIGRGSALLLGIRLPINFNLPYLAIDCADFWKRWHISLSTWLRDYIYVPLGGSRGNSFLFWRNTMITMLLCGLWHGASWHYVMFGGLHGIGLIINREWKSLLKRMPALDAALDNWVGHTLARMVTLLYIIPTYAVFRAPDMPHLINVVVSLKNVSRQCYLMGAIEKVGILQIMAVYMLVWMLTEYLQRHPKAFTWLRDGAPVPPLCYGTPVRLAAWTAACLLMFAVKPTTAVPFVYFQF
jgi:alginate O-acetyltransferase complex protein AlgI